MEACEINSHATINLDSPDLASMSSKEIEELVKSVPTVTVQVPIRRCWPYLDMNSDYLDASYAFETLAKLVNTPILRRVSMQIYASVLEINISDFSLIRLSERDMG